MVRDYKKKPGTRQYRNYTQAALDEALTEIADGRISIQKAAMKFKIPYATLNNKFRGKHIGKPGRQAVFSTLEERAILSAAAKCADWGFPLNLLDLRMMAKCFLEKKGRVVPRFMNNLPGKDWALSVLKRHKHLYGQRLATNIKQARSTVSRETVDRYFTNLEETLRDVPASNIFNYDESNVSDDPGKKWGIYKRGVKYPEKICNHSKSATTIMVCGAADGTLLPPYIIYKSMHLYDTWKEGGPVAAPCCDQACCSRGSRYNRINSGWIDTATFRDWFLTAFLPHAKRLEGRKVLIGDNLSSHLDDDVLRKCDENNISFVCLVPNSTHLTQPLDVGFFRAMKTSWRITLTEWKSQNLRLSSIPKDCFPRLLKKCLENMDTVKVKPSKDRRELPGDTEISAIRRILRNSFAATGLYPLNKFEVLKKLPENEDANQVTTNVESVLTKYLRERRFGNNNEQEAKKRKKRLNIEEGKSIGTLNEEENEQSNIQPCYSESSDSNHFGSDSSDIENLPSGSSQINEQACSSNVLTKKNVQTFTPPTIINLEENCFILVEFKYDENSKKEKNKQFVAQILDIIDDSFIVKCMRSYMLKKNVFVFPNVDDICEISLNNIKFKLSQPVIIRGRYEFPENIVE